MLHLKIGLILWSLSLIFFPCAGLVGDDLFYLMTSKKWVLEKQRSSTALDYEKENLQNFSMIFRRDLSGILEYQTRSGVVKAIPFKWNLKNSPSGEIILTTINMSMERSDVKTILGEPRSEEFYFIRLIRKTGYEDQIRLTIMQENEGIPIHLYLR